PYLTPPHRAPHKSAAPAVRLPCFRKLRQISASTNSRNPPVSYKSYRGAALVPHRNEMAVHSAPFPCPAAPNRPSIIFAAYSIPPPTPRSWHYPSPQHLPAPDVERR